MPTKPPQLFGGDVGAVTIPDPIGFYDYFGNSHISDPGLPFGANSTPDQGLAHKIDGLLNRGNYNNGAIAGAVLSYHNRGNGAAYDGGWGQMVQALGRDELIVGHGASTLTAGTTAGANTAIPVAERSYFLANELVVVGAGSTEELCRVVSTYVSAAGAGNVTVASTVNNHLISDPIYYAASNQGGFLARSSVTMLSGVINDLATMGPRDTAALDALVFGTNAGAARGLSPAKNALRFMIALARCSVVYRNTHPSCLYSGWSPNVVNSALSWPASFAFSGTNLAPSTGAACNYQSCVTTAKTVTVTTPPDYDGKGAVDFFFLAGTAGSGALLNCTVDASATPAGVTFNGASSGTGCVDARNSNARSANDSLAGTADALTPVALRIVGMSAGVHTIVFSSVTVSTSGVYLGWGIEASTPPLTLIMMDPRAFSYANYAGTPYGYGPKSMAGAKTATVSAGAGTAGSSVTLGSAVTLATAGVINALAAMPGDTITIGTGATQETRRVVAYDSTTALHVDANFVFTHTGEAVQIGLQDADLVGGGYANLADVQGKTSVPGMRGMYISLLAEFDAMVELVDLDLPIVGGPGAAGAGSATFGPDGLHYNDMAAAKGAIFTARRISQSKLTIDGIGLSVVPNRRWWQPVYGDSAVSPAPSALVTAFQNGWSNQYARDATQPKTRFIKDMYTRAVYVAGAIYGGTDSAVWSMPTGLLPDSGFGRAYLPGYGTAGPGALVIYNTGQVFFHSGYPGTLGWFEFSGFYVAGGV